MTRWTRRLRGCVGLEEGDASPFEGLGSGLRPMRTSACLGTGAPNADGSWLSGEWEMT